jgi:hypothetical protein
MGWEDRVTYKDGPSGETGWEGRVNYAEGEQERSISGFGDNLVDSAVEYGKDFIQMPIDVLTMAADLGVDTFNTVFNGGEIDVDTDNPTAAGFKALMTEEGREALGQYYAERYGGMDNFQESLYNDPIGVISDIAMIAMPAMAAKNIAKASAKVGVKGADSVADAFERAQRTLDKFDPINATGMAVTTGVNKLAADNYAAKLYQEIIKPSNTIPQETKTQIITHMLDNGITPDMAGANAAQARISDALAQSDAIVEGSTATMPASDMLGYYEGQANPSQATVDMDASAIARAKAAQARVDAMEPSFSPVGEDGPLYRPDLTAEQVRGQRRSADDQVKYDKGGQANTSSDNAKLNKGQADYLRAQLGEMVPEIKPLNRQISMDIPAKEFAEKAAKMAGNNNTIGLGAKIMGGSNLAKGLLMMVADNPANKARVARYVHRAQNDPIVNRAAPMQNGLRNLLQFEGRQGEYVAELLREEEERRRLEEMGII